MQPGDDSRAPPFFGPDTSPLGVATAHVYHRAQAFAGIRGATGVPKSEVARQQRQAGAPTERFDPWEGGHWEKIGA